MTFKTWKRFTRRDLRFPLTRDDILPLAKGIVIILLLGRLFYDSWIATLLLTPLLVPFFKRERRMLQQSRRRALGIQFKDAIRSVAASQRAGYSVENAFLEARNDMASLYGKDSPICRELEIIGKGIKNARTLEDMLQAFAHRTKHPDIMEFADIFRVAKRGGGNMTQVIADTVKIISDKAEAERQIGVIISGKRTESRLMEAVPLLIILYIGLTNAGFFEPLYHNVIGIVIMTVALVLYIAAYLMIESIVEIEV